MFTNAGLITLFSAHYCPCSCSWLCPWPWPWPCPWPCPSPRPLPCLSPWPCPCPCCVRVLIRVRVRIRGHSNILFILCPPHSRICFTGLVSIFTLPKILIPYERVQRRFTKSFHNLRSLPYSTRTERLDLQPLHIRRLNIDLTTCYHLIRELTHLDSTLFFTLRPHSVTRGHPFTLTKPLVRLNTNKFSFFSRAIDPWNNLPLISVTFGSLPPFKFKLEYPPVVI